MSHFICLALSIANTMTSIHRGYNSKVIVNTTLIPNIITNFS